MWETVYALKWFRHPQETEQRTRVKSWDWKSMKIFIFDYGGSYFWEILLGQERSTTIKCYGGICLCFHLKTTLWKALDLASRVQEVGDAWNLIVEIHLNGGYTMWLHFQSGQPRSCQRSQNQRHWVRSCIQNANGDFSGTSLTHLSQLSGAKVHKGRTRKLWPNLKESMLSCMKVEARGFG